MSSSLIYYQIGLSKSNVNYSDSWRHWCLVFKHKEINHFNNAFPDVLNNQNCLYYNIKTFNSECTELNQIDFSMIHLNIRSLAASGDDFYSYISTFNLNFDVICSSETWITESNLSDDHVFPLYNIYHSSRLPDV